MILLGPAAPLLGRRRKPICRDARVCLKQGSRTGQTFLSLSLSPKLCSPNLNTFAGSADPCPHWQSIPGALEEPAEVSWLPKLTALDTLLSLGQLCDVKSTAGTKQAILSDGTPQVTEQGADSQCSIGQDAVGDLPHQIHPTGSEVGWGRGCLCAGTSGEQRRGR